MYIQQFLKGDAPKLPGIDDDVGIDQITDIFVDKSVNKIGDGMSKRIYHRIVEGIDRSRLIIPPNDPAERPSQRIPSNVGVF